MNSRSRTDRRIGLVGGGRWGRVIARETANLLSSNETLVWCTHHDRKKALEVALELPCRVEIFSTLADVVASGMDAAIVANDSRRHALCIQTCLEHRIPVLSEKPIALNEKELEQLVTFSEQQDCPLGINLVFIHASFIDQFASIASKLEPSHVQMTWGDPWSEIRHGEAKRVDLGMSILQDQLPHCWSILTKLFPNDSFRLEHVSYRKDGSAVCNLISLKREVEIDLSRRAVCRIRKISLDDGRVSFDFAEEPGKIFDGETCRSLDWTGTRPLATSLRRFLAIVEDPSREKSWELAVFKHLAMLKAIFPWEATLQSQMSTDEKRLDLE